LHEDSLPFFWGVADFNVVKKCYAFESKKVTK